MVDLNVVSEVVTQQDRTSLSIVDIMGEVENSDDEDARDVLVVIIYLYVYMYLKYT